MARLLLLLALSSGASSYHHPSPPTRLPSPRALPYTSPLPLMALDPPPSKAEKLSKAVQMLKSHHKSMHSRTSGGGQTGQLLTAAAALTALSFATAAPPTPLLFSAAKISLVAASVGFFSLHAAVSYGYGLSLAGHAGTLLGMCAGSPARSILSLTVLLYGVKVCLLQLVRDSRPSYTKRVLSAFTGLVPSTKVRWVKSAAKSRFNHHPCLPCPSPPSPPASLPWSSPSPCLAVPLHNIHGKAPSDRRLLPLIRRM